MPKHMSPFGIYSDRPTVSDAIDVLRGAGYQITGTSVVLHQNEGNQAFAHEMGRKAPAGAAMGAAVGAAIGAVLAWLSAIIDGRWGGNGGLCGSRRRGRNGLADRMVRRAEGAGGRTER